MARTISIVVDADASGYRATLAGITEANKKMTSSAVQGAQQTTQAAQQTNQTYSGLAAVTSTVTLKHRELGSAITIVGSQLAGLGPVASLASNAVIGLATAGGATGIALAALAATVGLLMY